MITNNHQLINQTSGITEYYTPTFIVEAAWRTMGRIDLDPASSERANKIVKAERFFTKEDDGLKQPWHGTVWMNHPFSRAGNRKWINKLIEEWNDGNITAACCITFASTSEEWFGPLMEFPQCFLVPRTHYIDPVTMRAKRGVSKGSVVTHIGEFPDRFYREFKGLGVVKQKYVIQKL